MKALILAGLLLALSTPALADNSQFGSPTTSPGPWLEKPCVFGKHLPEPIKTQKPKVDKT